MFKRIGLLALMLSSIGVSIAPKVAFAQDGYYGSRGYYYQNDRGYDRHREHEWREHERRERREEERRERDWRRNEWRAQEWREQARHDRYRRDYDPNFYYGYQR